MQLELNESFKGKILVAMPNIHSDIFRDSLVYITEHNTVSGAIGVIINKDLHGFENEVTGSSRATKISTEFHDKHQQWNLPFYMGGPVDYGSGFILHTAKGNSKPKLTASAKVVLGTEDEIEPMLLTSGYCLWDTLQLEREVKHNQWLILDSAEILFELMKEFTPESRYEEALRILGVTTLANFDFSRAGNA